MSFLLFADFAGILGRRFDTFELFGEGWEFVKRHVKKNNVETITVTLKFNFLIAMPIRNVELRMLKQHLVSRQHWNSSAAVPVLVGLPAA